jgi:hypothetical protein
MAINFEPLFQTFFLKVNLTESLNFFWERREGAGQGLCNQAYIDKMTGWYRLTCYH